MDRQNGHEGTTPEQTPTYPDSSTHETDTPVDDYDDVEQLYQEWKLRIARARAEHAARTGTAEELFLRPPPMPPFDADYERFVEEPFQTRRARQARRAEVIDLEAARRRREAG